MLTAFFKKKAKKPANASLQALIEFVNSSDVQRLRAPRKSDSPAKKRLDAILARDAHAAKNDLAKLREELKNDLADLLTISNRKVKLARVAGIKGKAFADFSPEGILENILNKAYQRRPKFLTFRVRKAKEGFSEDGPITFIDFRSRRFAVEMQSFDSSASRLFYQILDASIRDGTFSRVKLCAKCEGFFLARVCKRCVREKRNRVSKISMRKLRILRRKQKEQRERESKEAAAFTRFESFLVKARSGKPALEMEVFPIVKRLGGWPRIKGWDGKRAADIWRTLGRKDRMVFDDEFS